jgi:hypothetical protein
MSDHGKNNISSKIPGISTGMTQAQKDRTIAGNVDADLKLV